MENKTQKWLLTHDSHELKKGQFFEGETLPAYLVGKAVLSAGTSLSPEEQAGVNELRQEIETLTNKLSEAQALITQKDADNLRQTDELEQMQKTITGLQAKLKAAKG
ncbi:MULTISPECIES: hypothetical protein [Enterobacterales]|uniref:hypothetical protein n=1 Tax=Enterobacterales TaxID=91347 RepID=UPI002EDA0EA9